MHLEDVSHTHPKSARLIMHTLADAFPRARTEYEQQPAGFFDEMEAEIGRIERTEQRPLESCLEDLDGFNALTEEMENDAWYEKRRAFVSMHLDFLLLGFGRRRLDKLQEYARTVGGNVFLDVGSGCGRLAALLLREHSAWQGTLVDKSPAARAYAQAYLATGAEGPRSTVATGDLLALPCAEAAFDLVIAAEVLEHTTDADRSATELLRVLRPGGHLAISLPIDLDIAMHPVVFESAEAIDAFFRRYALKLVQREIVRPVPGLDAITTVFPKFQGCLHATYRKL